MSFLISLIDYDYSTSVIVMVTTDRLMGQYLGFIDTSVSASVGVDKTQLYSSCIQTTCTGKHSKLSQDSYLAAMLSDAFS